MAGATSATPARVRRRSKRAAVRPGVLRIIEGLHDQPAYVRNHRIGILAARPPVHPPARPPVRPSARPLVRALLGEVEQQPANTCRSSSVTPAPPGCTPDGNAWPATESGCCG
ncbi:hypothetical protein [Streptomyces sp. PBH53]|uniref:hypothetical protein n=1 Tax=Streptomyces sp. PBH53 TaxID=1577075 RepID=UPI001AD805C1|nr:hypothetical protein [Streptomyces sp. PBH53]